MVLIVSQKYVVVKVDGAPPADPVMELRDGGETYAVVPADRWRGACSPALEDPDTGELAIPTARLTLRGGLNSPALRDALDAAGARIIRDYGKAGMIEAPTEAAARALTRILQDLAEVDSVEQQVLRPRAYK